LSCSDRHRLPRSLAVLVALLAACSERRPPMPPRPLSIDPPVAYGSVPTPLVIRGDGFYVRGVQLASGGSRVDTSHRAWLGGLELSGVAWLDLRTLRGVVPAGLSPGTYDLTVENALGDRGSIAGAYRVIAGSPALLRAGIDATPVANLGQVVTVTVTVTNDGDGDALAVAPVLSASGSGALAPLGTPPAPSDVPARSARRFSWSFQALAVGDVALDLQGGGRDGGTGLDVGLPHAGASMAVVRPAALAVRILSAPALVNVGQAFDVTLRVQNQGDSDAAAVSATLAVPNATPDATAVALGTLGGGASRDVTRSFTAAGLGTASITAGAAGTDATDGSALAGAADAWPLQVQQPAALSATLSIPTPLVVGDFTATLTLVNTGGATALGVAPPAAPLAIGGGTGVVTYVSGPVGAPADLPAGQAATFTWTYHVASVGTVQLSATATGTDATSGASLAASSTSNVATVPEAVRLAADAFGDGTAFSFATEYHGQLWLGPSASGAGVVSMNLDGSARQAVALAFPEDVVSSGVKSANTWAGAPPFPALGALGCQTNTASCGPDNENGRGFFTSVTLAGTEWLVAVGAKPGGSLHYAYMTSDTASPLSFRYLDLSQQLSGETRTVSAIAALQDRLYMGFPGKGAQSPFLLVLTATPPAPGLDPPASYATTLEMSRMPYLGASGTPKNNASVILVDALTAFSNRLYVANNGGFARSTTPQPRPYTTAPSDWATCTPAAVVKMAVTTAKQSDLEPADKAVPQMAIFGARLFAIRNVYLSGTTGPVGGQLWRCTPTALDAADALPQCAPADWSLMVPDDGADGRAAATLLIASARYLYVGFDRAGGARVFRTEIPIPSSLSDFAGQGGCVAGSTGCQGLGGDGLGDPSNARLLDARVITDAQGKAALYVSTGDPSATPPVPVRVYRIPE
jgi:hypothetical protein